MTSTVVPMPARERLRRGSVGFFCELPKPTVNLIAKLQSVHRARKWQIVAAGVRLLAQQRVAPGATAPSLELE